MTEATMTQVKANITNIVRPGKGAISQLQVLDWQGGAPGPWSSSNRLFLGSTVLGAICWLAGPELMAQAPGLA